MDGGLPTDSAPSGLRRLLVVHRNETADTHSVELQLYLQFPVKGGLEYVPEPVRIAHRNLVVFEPSAGRKVVRRFGTGLRRIRTDASNIYVEIRIQITPFAYLMRLYSGVCMSWHFAVSAADSCLFTAYRSVQPRPTRYDVFQPYRRIDLNSCLHRNLDRYVGRLVRPFRYGRIAELDRLHFQILTVDRYGIVITLPGSPAVFQSL